MQVEVGHVQTLNREAWQCSAGQKGRPGRNKEQGQGRAESRQGRTLGRKLGRARQGGAEQSKAGLRQKFGRAGCSAGRRLSSHLQCASVLLYRAIRSGSGENNIRMDSARSAGRISVTWRTTGILYCPSNRNTQKPLNPFSRSRREKSFPTIYQPEREVDKQEHATSETPNLLATWWTRDMTGRRTLGKRAVWSLRSISAFFAEPS